MLLISIDLEACGGLLSDIFRFIYSRHCYLSGNSICFLSALLVIDVRVYFACKFTLLRNGKCMMKMVNRCNIRFDRLNHRYDSLLLCNRIYRFGQ